MKEDTAKGFCSILMDVLEARGVREAVCSPGSRNAPLLIAAAHRDTMRKHVAVDERSAAFMALGMAMTTRRPVLLICTSGTAMLNYAPAVAEAFYHGVPLIVLSADRPEQWIDQDDSQTLRQFEALSNYVKRSYEIPAVGEDLDELQWYVNRIANDACIEATSGRPGPVHVNVRLGEPLGLKRERVEVHPRTIEMIEPDGFASRKTIDTLASGISGKRVMLVAGFMPPDASMHRAVAQMLSLPNVALMAETLSNLNVGHDSWQIDSVLTGTDNSLPDEACPDIVISVGGSLVSRKLKEYLRRNRSRVEHWSLGRQHTTVDCFMSLTRRIDTDPSVFLRQLAGAVQKLQGRMEPSRIPQYGEIWERLRRDTMQCKERYVDDVLARTEGALTEMEVFMALDDWERSTNLFLSNGTAVRYAQLFGSSRPHAVYCNRGVSGIEGSVSTAVGGAKAYSGRTVLVTGDLSMAYDIGALALPDVPDSMRIIVIDNRGGGIFRFINTTSGLDECERYFCAPPLLPLRQLAEGYGWDYEEIDSSPGLDFALRRFVNGRGPKAVLRIKVDPELSAETLKGYMRATVKGEV